MFLRVFSTGDYFGLLLVGTLRTAVSLRWSKTKNLIFKKRSPLHRMGLTSNVSPWL